MIWVTSILLIAVAIWLILEGRNERQWVHDHLDDEAVAADKGLFAKFDELKEAPEPEQRYSVATAEGKIGNLAAKAKEKTAKIGQSADKSANSDSAKLDAQRKARAQRGNTLTGPDSFIGRTADKLSAKTAAVTDKIPEGRLISDSHDNDLEPSRTRKLINSITARLDRIDEKVG